MTKTEIITTTAVALTLVFTVLSAIIGATVYVARLDGRVEALHPEQIKQAASEAEQRLMGAYPDLRERISKIEQRGEEFATRLTRLESASVFGPWQAIEANHTNQAPSDGFVVGFAHNNGEFSFRIGPTPSDLVERGRIKQYEGMMMPVKCGQYYHVNANSGSPRHIDVYWLPLGSQNPSCN